MCTRVHVSVTRRQILDFTPVDWKHSTGDKTGSLSLISPQLHSSRCEIVSVSIVVTKVVAIKPQVC